MTKLPRYAAMLAAPGPLPSDDNRWAYEMKFDGIRAIGYIADELRLVSRNGNDITTAWPELAALAPADPPVVVDGEIVIFDAAGRPSFEALQPRMHRRRPTAIQALAAADPATYVLFDLLHIGDRPLIHLPYQQRRQLLEQTGLHGPRWQISPQLRGRGADLLDRSRRLGIEGIIAKRLDSPYRPGQRSPTWTKLKNVRHQDVIVVGWRPGRGNRAGRIGSLLLAIPDRAGNLVYVGSAGTGLSTASLNDLRTKLQPLQRTTAPVVNAPLGAEISWTEPRLVGEVEFAEWTRDGILRRPVWRGIRPEIPPESVAREQ